VGTLRSDATGTPRGAVSFGGPLDSEPFISGTAFAALLEQGEVGPALRDELGQLGVEPGTTREQYPVKVWLETTDAVRRAWFPALSPQPGFTAVGRRIIDGFLDKPGGNVIGWLMASLTAERAIVWAPRLLRMGRPGFDRMMTTTMKGDRHFVIRVADASLTRQPLLVAGIVAAGLEKMGVQPRVTMGEQDSGSYEFEVRWDG
jgi:uncharacterized protein (TIGR02265 family)